MSKLDSILAPALPSYGAKLAHDIVNVARRAGKIPPPGAHVCVDCGARATVYDHRDYNKPLDVAPVCQSCNIRRGPAIPLQSTTKTSSGFVCSNLGVVQVEFEVVDFYPVFDSEARTPVAQQESQAASLENCWRV